MRRLVVLAMVLVLGAAPLTSSASAAEVSVSVAVVGARSITTLTLPALVSGTPSVLTAVVAETNTVGTNPWSITARLCKPNAATPTTADCTTSALVNTADATKTIAGSNMSISDRAVVQATGGGTSTATTGTQTMDAARTVFSNAGQNTALNYTGTYTGTANVTLTVPNTTAAGTYNGFVVVDLVQ